MSFHETTGDDLAHRHPDDPGNGRSILRLTQNVDLFEVPSPEWTHSRSFAPLLRGDTSNRAMRLGKRHSQIAEGYYRRQVEQQLDHWLKHYPNHPDRQRLHQRYCKHRTHLLVFLQRADMPPTDNASRHARRNSVIYRKVTGGFRSPAGAQDYTHLFSILETARRQQRSFLDILAALIAGQPAFLPLRQ